MPEVVERRRHRRIDAMVMVEIQKYDANAGDIVCEKSVSRNMSLGGLLMLHREPLEVPSYVIVSFTLPGMTGGLDFLGKVLRIEEIGENLYEVGVMFMRMILGEFSKLRGYIEKASGGSRRDRR